MVSNLLFSRMNIPGKLTGGHPLVNWLNRLVQWNQSDRLVSVVGGNLQQTPNGRVLVIASHAAISNPVTRLRVKEQFPDYLRCHTWDGTTEGTDDVLVAKPPKLRNVDEETLDGTLYTYEYTNSGTDKYVERVSTNTDDDTEETQRIVPRFIDDDEIFAISAKTGMDDGDVDNPQDINLLDLNVDARAWTAQTDG